VKNNFDYVLLDCNPNLGMLTINALAAANTVIIPVSTQLWSASGLNALLQTILKVKKMINRELDIEGVLLTQTHENTILDREMVDIVNNTFGSTIKIFDTSIPYTTKIGMANKKSTSIIDYDKNSKAAHAFIDFASELMNLA
jgi:chromosome partitioning protein